MNSTTTMGAEDRGGTGTEAAGAIDTTRTAGTRVTEAAIDAEGADAAADEAIDEAIDGEEDRETTGRCRSEIGRASCRERV